MVEDTKTVLSKCQRTKLVPDPRLNSGNLAPIPHLLKTTLMVDVVLIPHFD